MAESALTTVCVAVLSLGRLHAAEDSSSAQPPTGGPRFVLSTTRDCEIRGGEFFAPPNAQPDDIVDCRLPSQIRALGKPPVPARPSPIVASVYHYLTRPGAESPAYGLYSYVLLPSRSSRAEKLLSELFGTTPFASIEGITVPSLHVIQLPARREKVPALLAAIADPGGLRGARYAGDFYDYGLAQRLLVQICARPAEAVRGWCQTDLSRGPYLFTYAKPVSALATVPPPYLVLDLSPVHERAFTEVVAAYKEQVKRVDYTDMQRIDTLRLRVLNIVLTAADWIDPITRAMTTIVHVGVPDGGAKPAR